MRPASLSALLVLLDVLFVPIVRAQNWQYTDRDMAMLPAYCKYSQDFRKKIPGGDNPAEIKRLTGLMGGTANDPFSGMFPHIHHYCWAMLATNRALFSRNAAERKAYLTGSIGDFDYVLKHASDYPTFVLLPEILTKKAENLLKLGRGPQAAVELETAMKLKPDYWPPYLVLADYYASLGQAAKAREVVHSGLNASPNAKALLDRMKELERTP